MGTVTGYTAAKMDEILSAVIEDARVNAGNLEVKKYGSDVWVNLGSVIGPEGPEGPEGSVSSGDLSSAIATEVTNRNTAITEAKNDIGHGLIAHTTVGVDQVWGAGYDPMDWLQWITSANVTFVPVSGHYYQFVASCVLKTECPLGGYFDFELIRDNGSGGIADVLFRESAYVNNDSVGVGVSGSRIILAPTTVSTTFRLRVRTNVDGNDYDSTVSGVYCPTFISVVDLGTL